MSKFKIGDKVKIARRVDKENGWYDSWVKDMDSFIGSTGVISNCDEKYGYEIVSDTWLGPVAFRFPAGAFELIESAVQAGKPKGKYQYITEGKLSLSIYTEIVKSSEGNKVFWSVSFKNPKDKFSKFDARKSLTEKPRFVIDLGKTFSRNEILAKILFSLLYHENAMTKDYRNFVRYLVSTYDVYDWLLTDI